MWRELVTKLCDSATFSEGATWAEIELAGESLGVAFPDHLRDALREANGIEGEYGLGLLWPVSRILSDNQAFRDNSDFRQLYMPFDHLLFFADAGNGDQFAYAIQGDEIRRPDIFVWNHEEDSRTWAAPSLDKYLEWWLKGDLTL